MCEHLLSQQRYLAMGQRTASQNPPRVLCRGLELGLSQVGVADLGVQPLQRWSRLCVAQGPTTCLRITLIYPARPGPQRTETLSSSSICQGLQVKCQEPGQGLLFPGARLRLLCPATNSGTVVSRTRGFPHPLPCGPSAPAARPCLQGKPFTISSMSSLRGHTRF